MDEKYLKPFLIYKYEERKEDIKEAKKELKLKQKENELLDEKLFDDAVRMRRIMG